MTTAPTADDCEDYLPDGYGPYPAPDYTSDPVIEGWEHPDEPTYDDPGYLGADCDGLVDLYDDDDGEG